MERLPVMLLGWYAGKDTTGEDALCFSVCKKLKSSGKRYEYQEENGCYTHRFHPSSLM